MKICTTPIRPSASPLWCDQGFKYQQQKLETCTRLAWIAAYTILWNGRRFNERIINSVLNSIYAFLLRAESPEAGLSELIQRVLLARKNLESDYGRVRTSPSTWFSSRYDGGFNQTAPWYYRLAIKRMGEPSLARSLQAFADAVLEYGEAPTTHLFHKWRSFFQQRENQQPLNLFLAYAANLQHAG